MRSSGVQEKHILPAYEASSFEELHRVVDEAVSYYHENGWVHLKMTQLEDRRLGGVYTDRQGNEYTFADSANFYNDVVAPSTYDTNYLSVWPFHMGSGMHQAGIQIDLNSVSGEQTCEAFDEPEFTSKFAFNLFATLYPLVFYSHFIYIRPA